jgi:8-oxo-dGTP pyrophosphatase MutT (NUDIX family)
MSEFKLKPGQVDFTNIRWAPVINCLVRYDDKFLVVQRNAAMRLYPNFWNGISGFLDDNKSLKEKVAEELWEELGLAAEHIISIKQGQIFNQESEEYKKTWIVHPVLVDINTNMITLDHEATSYQWLQLSEIRQLTLLPGFDHVLSAIEVLL